MEKGDILNLLREFDKNEQILNGLAAEDPKNVHDAIEEFLAEQLVILAGDVKDLLDSFRRSNKNFRDRILLYKEGRYFLERFSPEEIIKINQIDRKIPEIESEISKIEEVISRCTKEDVINKSVFQARIGFIRSWQEEARKFLYSKK